LSGFPRRFASPWGGEPLGGDLYLEEGIPRIFYMLIKPIRDADGAEGRDFLRRFFMRPDQLWKATLDRIRSLSTIDNAETIRDDLVDQLLPHVGFTSEFADITSQLDIPTKRKLIRAAAQLWKERGSTQGLFQWIRFLAGRNPRYLSWFDDRWVIGDTSIRHARAIGGRFSNEDYELSRLRIMDDGSLDRTLVLNLIELTRMVNERVDVAILDFLDTFFLGRNLWTSQATPAATVVSNAFVLAPGCEEQAVMASSSFGGYSWRHKFTLGAGCTHRVIWNRLDGLNYYKLEIKSAAPEVVLTNVTGGSGTVLASTSVGRFDIIDGVDYELRVDTFGTSNPRQLQVFIDGVKVIDVQDATSGPEHRNLRPRCACRERTQQHRRQRGDLAEPTAQRDRGTGWDHLVSKFSELREHGDRQEEGSDRERPGPGD
jgi:phage tail-like protein